MEDAEPPLFYIEANPLCEQLRTRYCDECGVYIDTDNIPLLEEVHLTCWKEYRRKGKLYPMPLHAGE